MLLRLLSLILLICFSACEKKATVNASFANNNKSTSEFILSIASTPKVRAMGLMHVREMPANEGMIFVFPKEEQQSFWMKNTYISLDIIFVNSKLEVVGLLENVPILNEAPRKIAADSLYVVELIAGSSKKYGIKIGDRLVLDRELKATY